MNGYLDFIDHLLFESMHWLWTCGRGIGVLGRVVESEGTMSLAGMRLCWIFI